MTFLPQKIRSFALASCLAVLIVSPLAAQKPKVADALRVRPNFSGRWKMVKNKSQFNGFKVPDQSPHYPDHRWPDDNVRRLILHR
jgi:hypothetical protein